MTDRHRQVKYEQLPDTQTDTETATATETERERERRGTGTGIQTETETKLGPKGQTLHADRSNVQKETQQKTKNRKKE